jgi:uncharacterized membrane protein
VSVTTGHGTLVAALPGRVIYLCEVIMNRATIAGHPIHPMLVTIPIGLWIFSLVCDVIFASTGDAVWHTTAYLTLGGGIVGALLAAVPGLIDLLTLHEGAERRTGVLHMVLNLAIVAVQGVNFWIRSMSEYSFPVVLGISVVAVGALGVTQPHRDATGAATTSGDRLRPRT